MSQETRRSNKERNKYGICLNDECPKCKGKEVQQIPMRKEFVCAECGSELRECPPPKKRNNKLIAFIVAVIVIVGGVIAAIVIPKGSEPTLLTLNKTLSEMTVGECDTIVARVTPLDDDLEVHFRSSNEDVAMVNSMGVVRAIAEGESAITVEVQPKKGNPIMQEVAVKVRPQMDCNTDTCNAGNDSVEVSHDNDRPMVKKTNTKTTSNTGTLTLSYGKYNGAIKNGYPHGQGRLTYKTNRIINRNDPKGRTANPGDYVIGEFFNGFVVYGKHYNSAGELLESLNIGVGSESSYDSK